MRRSPTPRRESLRRSGLFDGRALLLAAIGVIVLAVAILIDPFGLRLLPVAAPVVGLAIGAETLVGVLILSPFADIVADLAEAWATSASVSERRSSGVADFDFDFDFGFGGDGGGGDGGD